MPPPTRLGSHTPLFEQWERHLSHQGRLDELFLLFSDSTKAGEDQILARSGWHKGLDNEQKELATHCLKGTNVLG